LRPAHCGERGSLFLRSEVETWRQFAYNARNALTGEFSLGAKHAHEESEKGNQEVSENEEGEGVAAGQAA
jgi:hypothetical protein